MAGLTPQLTADQRTAWAERILRENNQTQRNRDVILARVQHRASERTAILGNNQDLICAYLILAMNEPTASGNIINPITGRLILLNRDVHNRLLSNCNLRATGRRPTSAPPTQEQRQAAAEIREVLQAAATPLPSTSSSSRSSSSPRNNTPDRLNTRMTQAQREQWARNLLGNNINENILRSNQENRTALVNEFMMSDARNVPQIIHGRLNIIQTLRNSLTQDEVCAYYILSGYTIDPRTGSPITNNSQRVRMQRECNLLPPAAAPPAAAPAAERVTAINAGMTREQLTQWARGIAGEVLIPGMMMPNVEYRTSLERTGRYTNAQISAMVRTLREAREQLTPQEVCAYLILSNYRMNPRTGNRIDPSATTLYRLLRNCNLSTRNLIPPQNIQNPTVQPINIIHNNGVPIQPLAPNAPIRPRSPSTSREQPSNGEFNAAAILNQCNNTFGHIVNDEGNQFRDLAKFMSKTCSKVLEPEISERDKPNAFIPRIKRVRERIVRNLELRSAQYYIRNVDAKNILPFVFNEWLKHHRSALFFTAKFNGFYTIQNRFYGVGVDAGGVTKDIFSSLAEQIALFTSAGYPNPECGQNAEKLFTETSQGSGRYTINRKFKLSQFVMNIPDVTAATIRTDENLEILQNGISLERIDGYSQINERLNATFATEHEKTQALWNFIGQYYIFCIINNIPIGINLSHALLAFLYITVIPRENRGQDMNAEGKKLMTYYLMDYSHSPGLARTIIQRDGYMMQPDIYLTAPGANESDYNIAGTFNGYRDQFFSDEPPFNLLADDQPVTVDNLSNYIYRVAIADEIGITEPRREKFYYIDNFIRGFTSIRNIHSAVYNAIRKKPVLTLDLLLSAYAMPTKPAQGETMAPYPANHQYTNEEKESMKYFAFNKINFGNNTDWNTQIIQWFREILFNYGSDYPSEDAPELKERLFIEFFKKLIKFWTGTQNIPITPIKVHYINVPRTQRRLPQSHTCFNSIDIPNNIVSKADLYNRLLLAVYEGNQGIALA